MLLTHKERVKGLVFIPQQQNNGAKIMHFDGLVTLPILLLMLTLKSTTKT